MHLKSVDYSKYITVVDMGLLWRLSTPSPADRGKGDRIVNTWKNYEEKVFGTILKRHTSVSMGLAINDYYGNGGCK